MDAVTSGGSGSRAAGEAGGGYDTFDWRAAWYYPNPPPRADELEPPTAARDAAEATNARPLKKRFAKGSVMTPSKACRLWLTAIMTGH